MSGLDMEKKPNGRKKIEIAHMQNQKNLNVTFSKRRNGLFKKSSEISILCGAEVATVIFSQSNSVYSIGNPSVNSIVDRFLGVNPPPDVVVPNTSSKPHQNAYVDETNKELSDMEGKMKEEKYRGEMLDEALSTDVPYEKLSDFKLQKLRETFEVKLKEANILANQKRECGI
ncbi:hypothetical protein HAX54_012170, partial [Datura stramonium]|nr:hypothetical protein [Datura stramonium]